MLGLGRIAADLVSNWLQLKMTYLDHDGMVAVRAQRGLQRPARQAAILALMVACVGLMEPACALLSRAEAIPALKVLMTLTASRHRQVMMQPFCSAILSSDPSFFAETWLLFACHL